jgi:hypothetical protein
MSKMRSEFKEARIKYGKIDLAPKSIHHHYNPLHKYGESKCICTLSILHDNHHNEDWAIAFKKNAMICDCL